tara:strand:- start:500 stop:1597 length:1098 start_codon:yes stop_codon:yes gene_type:complete
MSLETLEVKLEDRSYPIHIGEGILASERLLQPAIVGKQVAIITNEIIEPLYLDDLLGALRSYKVDVHVLRDGEEFKTIETFNQIIDFLISKKHGRSTTIIALGGGVVGDVTGFAASAFQRGVNYIQIPTTLLAQVDSSVGGKTAINHSKGKNLVGAFYQPRAVIADISVLETLSSRDFGAGLAEVIKYGVIFDHPFFSWVQDSSKELLKRDPAALALAIRKSCEIKAQVVARDEREAGIRAILNFGHTFGHAIEAMTEYTEYLHGEAVAIGMTMAADISSRLGYLSGDQAKQIKTTIADAGLPTTPPDFPIKDWLNTMGMDKKVVDGELRLVLAEEIGKAFVAAHVDQEVLRETLSAKEYLCVSN